MANNDPSVKKSAFLQVAIFSAVSLAVGLVLGGLVLCTCPEDYWPHQAFTTDGNKCDDLLKEIQTQGFADYNDQAASATTRAKIQEAVGLVLACAWQDLPDHTDDQKSKHALAVKKAHDAAMKPLATNPNKWTQVVTFMTEGVDHPH